MKALQPWTALDEIHGVGACAALAKRARIGLLLASMTRAREVLRTMAEAASRLHRCHREV